MAGEDKYVLDLLVAVVGIGAIGLVVLLANGRLRFVFAALIGIFSALLFATEIDSVPKLQIYAELFFGGALGGVVTALLVLAALHLYQGKKYQAFLTEMRSSLEPIMWLDEAERQTTTVASADALARRWFVAVGAATGGIVFGLITYPEFWSALLEAVRPRGLLAAVVSTLVSVVLVGPVHDFVLARSLTDDEGERLPAHRVATAIWRELSWRSLLRLALVGVALLCLEIAYNCLGKSIDAAGAPSAAEASAPFAATITILLSGLTPGVVSYYWSSALQLGGSREMMKRAIGAATLCMTILFYVFGVLVCLMFAMLMLRNPTGNALPLVMLIVFSPALGGIIAVLFALLTTWLPAFAGAFVLRRLAGWPAMGALYVAIAITSVVPISVALIVVSLMAHAPTWTGFAENFVESFGWIVGLIASGFPKLVTSARQATPSQASPVASNDLT